MRIPSPRSAESTGDHCESCLREFGKRTTGTHSCQQCNIKYCFSHSEQHHDLFPSHTFHFPRKNSFHEEIFVRHYSTELILRLRDKCNIPNPPKSATQCEVFKFNAFETQRKRSVVTNHGKILEIKEGASRGVIIGNKSSSVQGNVGRGRGMGYVASGRKLESVTSGIPPVKTKTAIQFGEIGHGELLPAKMSSSSQLPQVSSTCGNCLEEFGECVEATHSCKDCKVHLCKADQLRHQKKHPKHTLVQIQVPQPTRLCDIHGQPLNAYCKTCKKLVCASCGLGAEHRVHNCFLLKDIEEEVRKEIELEWKELNDEISDWEKTVVDKNPPQFYEKERLRQRKDVKNLFDQLRVSLQARQDALDQLIDKTYNSTSNLVTYGQNIKKKRLECAAIFSSVDSISITQLIEAKSSIMKELAQAYGDIDKICGHKGIRYVFYNPESFSTVESSFKQLANFGIFCESPFSSAFSKRRLELYIEKLNSKE